MEIPQEQSPKPKKSAVAHRDTAEQSVEKITKNKYELEWLKENEKNKPAQKNMEPKLATSKLEEEWFDKESPGDETEKPLKNDKVIEGYKKIDEKNKQKAQELKLATARLENKWFNQKPPKEEPVEIHDDESEILPPAEGQDKVLAGYKKLDEENRQRADEEKREKKRQEKEKILEKRWERRAEAQQLGEAMEKVASSVQTKQFTKQAALNERAEEKLAEQEKYRQKLEDLRKIKQQEAQPPKTNIQKSETKPAPKKEGFWNRVNKFFLGK